MGERTFGVDIEAVRALPFSALSGPEAGEEIRDTLLSALETAAEEVATCHRLIAHVAIVLDGLPDLPPDEARVLDTVRAAEKETTQ